MKEPTTQDWMKLLRVLSDIKCTRYDVLTLEADDEHTLYWYVDSDFAEHEYENPYRICILFGKRNDSFRFYKQKVNARSSTELELIGVNDRISNIL